MSPEPLDAGDHDAHVPADLLYIFEVQEWDRAVTEADGQPFDLEQWSADLARLGEGS